jgi:hypothetical protein
MVVAGNTHLHDKLRAVVADGIAAADAGRAQIARSHGRPAVAAEPPAGDTPPWQD